MGLFILKVRRKGELMSPVFISSYVALSQKKGLWRHANGYNMNKHSFYVCTLHWKTLILNSVWATTDTMIIVDRSLLPFGHYPACKVLSQLAFKGCIMVVKWKSQMLLGFVPRLSKSVLPPFIVSIFTCCRGKMMWLSEQGNELWAYIQVMVSYCWRKSWSKSKTFIF